MMVRLLAYALHADSTDSLSFTRGLSETDEPDIWRLDLTGAIELWLETGLPDERRILKACGRSEQVVVLAYGRNASLWWQGVKNKLSRAAKFRALMLDADGTQALALLARRKMSLNVNVQDDTIWVTSDDGQASVQLIRLN
jgi:uncharacterized protein YaeQ